MADCEGLQGAEVVIQGWGGGFVGQIAYEEDEAVVCGGGGFVGGLLLGL